MTPGKVWELAKKEERIVLTANGRPAAILTGVDEDSLEEKLDAIDRAQVLIALDRIHQDSRVSKIIQFIRSRGMYSPALAQTIKLPDANDEPFF